jgi:hypothetical protein
MRIIVAVVILVGALTVSAGHPRAASCRFDGAAHTQLDQQRAAHIPVVYAQCRQGDGKSILILPIRTSIPSQPALPNANGLSAVDFRNDGLLIQYLRGPCAPSSAVIEFSNEKDLIDFNLGLSSGGEGTYRLSRALATELLRSDFHFLSEVSIREFSQSMPSSICNTQMDMLWRRPFVLPKNPR